MYQLILVLLAIVLAAAFALATAIYTPASALLIAETSTLVQSSLNTLQNAYVNYSNANQGAVPAVTGATDGGLSTVFSDYLPFVPQAPLGYAWSYGYNASRAQNWFCLSSTNPSAATNALFTGFVRATRVLPSSQLYVTQGGAANCGTTTSINTSTYTSNVALTFFVSNPQYFNPRAIPGLVAWLDASDASTLSGSGNAVTQWLDKSGNGNNAVNAVSGTQPLYSSTGFQGKGGVAFSRANSQFLEMAATATMRTTQVDTFVAGAMTASGANSTLISAQTTNNGNVPVYAWYLGQNDVGGSFPVDNGIAFNIGAGTTNYFEEPGTATSALNINSLWEGSYGGGSIQVAQNGQMYSASQSVAMAPVNYPIEIGRPYAGANNAYFLDGVIGEIAIYNRPLTAAERSRLNHYFGKKWSLYSLTS
ncbi:LamG domain-containing protein [Paraburkholderia sp. UCT31]|uniref:LamG-like jellyroll fold domain-containing protein n=1 Tax=Paraburkholderia sp. UCT31 TaxID=2615209 RepID=UPI00165625C7|nr:LamG-like jellyroll fold domain-containing protein [Paraburkholderia sp. UCT31]MBC8738489.1 LamG domain-containing protein [Paraburkholderia sp. UCT31]